MSAKLENKNIAPETYEKRIPETYLEMLLHLALHQVNQDIRRVAMMTEPIKPSRECLEECREAIVGALNAAHHAQQEPS